MARLKKRKDNRYQQQINVLDENGKRKRKSIYGNTKPELDEKVKKAIEAEKRKSNPGSLLTVNEWTKEWLKTKSKLAYNTRRMYELNVNNYITPIIGELMLIDVNQEHINRIIDTQTDLDHNRTGQTVHLTLSQIFNTARKRKYIILDPTIDIKRPKYSKPDKRALTDEEIEIIKTAPLALKEKAFIFCLNDTGIRRGESIALTRNDLDIRNELVFITKSVYFENGKAKVGPPKTKASIRKIPILDEFKPVINEYILSLKGDILFPDGHGNHMSESSFNHFWQGIVRKLTNAGITANDITPHIFRHTFCSYLVNSGVNIKDAQYVLGHGSAIITMDWYAHCDPKAPENIRNKLNRRVYRINRRRENSIYSA